jgi:DNA-3-methyladenine glycosylase I
MPRKNPVAPRQRCHWASTRELFHLYHDEEWGVPRHDDPLLFEMLLLEGAQAGLTWLTILKKREGYREAFDQFNPETIALYPERRLAALMKHPGIVRNRLKIQSAVQNARAFLAVREEFGSFDSYLWRFVDGRPVQNQWKRHHQVPASTKQSDALSKDLKKRGFNFVGSTIMYAFMQAVGMVNDHTTDCFRYGRT